MPSTKEWPRFYHIVTILHPALVSLKGNNEEQLNRVGHWIQGKFILLITIFPGGLIMQPIAEPMKNASVISFAQAEEEEAERKITQN